MPIPYQKKIVALSTMLVITANATANTVVFVNTPMIPAHTIMVPTSGYERCYYVPAMFDQGIWIPQHTECEYFNYDRPASVWITPYWGCDNWYRRDCQHWRWYPGHWYNGQPWNGHHNGPYYHNDYHGAGYYNEHHHEH